MAFPSDLTRTKNWGNEILTDTDLEGQLDLIINWAMAALDSSAGHNHNGTSNQSQKISYTGVTSTFVNGFTTVTGASGDYFLISDVSDSNNTKKALASDFIYTPTSANALAGSILQIQKTVNVTQSTVAVALPIDDTIPQNTEGGSLNVDTPITPSNSSNRLIIIVLANGSFVSTQSTTAGIALFQDSTANAICAGGRTITNNATMDQFVLIHEMAAGTTSATTFKARIGEAGGGTFTINGQNSARLFGGVMNCVMIVMEVKV